MARQNTKARRRSAAQRRADVARLFREICRERQATGRDGGPTTLNGVQQEIAGRLGVSKATISNDMKALDLEWREERLDYVQQAKDDALAELNKLSVAAWEEWERSKRPEIRATMRAENGSCATTIYRKEDASKSLPGDPRYLAEIRNIIERRAKILGFDAPTRTEQINIKPEWLELLTPEELDQAAEGKLGAAAIAALVSPRLREQGTA